MKKTRLYLLDEFRGLLVINMIVFHTIWDLVYMFGNDWQWYINERQGWRIWIGANFVLLSGLCWKMSRNPLKRGLIVYLCGAVVSVVTILFTPSAKIMFGVLTLIGSSMLLMTFCDVFLKKLHPIVGVLLGAICFVLTFGVNSGYLGFGDWKICKLPDAWYANWFTTYLGFPESGFESADYYTLLPWFFMFAIGYFLYAFLLGAYASDARREAVTRVLGKSICPPLGWVGRHALIIYMLHQPVIYGILSVVYMQ